MGDGTAGTVASGARGTGRGGVSTRRGACAVPGGGKDEKLFAKDIVALSQLRLLEMLSMDRESSGLYSVADGHRPFLRRQR